MNTPTNRNLRVHIDLDAHDVERLVALARAECRHPREQARWILKNYLNGKSAVTAELPDASVTALDDDG